MKEGDEMKRRSWLVGILGLVGLLVLQPDVGATERESCPQSPPPSQPSAAAENDLAGTVRSPRADDEFVEDLVSILNETHSPDAFLVTLSVLQELKPDARVVVPAIIRNAERLRLFKRTKADQATEEQRMIVECLAGFVKKDAEPATRPVTPPPANAVPPAPLTSDIFPRAPDALISTGSGQAAVPMWNLVPEPFAPPASRGDPKPTTDEVIPGTAKPRMSRSW
jgi:hypothetical protein